MKTMQTRVIAGDFLSVTITTLIQMTDAEKKCWFRSLSLEERAEFLCYFQAVIKQQSHSDDFKALARHMIEKTEFDLPLLRALAVDCSETCGGGIINQKAADYFIKPNSVETYRGLISNLQTLPALTSHPLAAAFSDMEEDERVTFVTGVSLLEPDWDGNAEDVLSGLHLTAGEFEKITARVTKIARIEVWEAQQDAIRLAVEEALEALNQAYHNDRVLPLSRIAGMTDAEQHDLFMTVSSGPVNHALRRRVYAELRIPDAIIKYEQERFRRLIDIFLEDSDGPMVAAYIDANRNGDNYLPRQRIEFARRHLRLMSDVFDLPAVPEFLVQNICPDTNGYFSRLPKDVVGRIGLNRHFSNNRFRVRFHNFMRTLNHEFGHTLTSHWAMRVSDYARRSLTRDQRAEIKKFDLADPLHAPTLLVSFNVCAAVPGAFYFCASDANPEISAGYYVQIDERHARAFADRTSSAIHDALLAVACLRQPEELRRMTMALSTGIARRIFEFRTSCSDRFPIDFWEKMGALLENLSDYEEKRQLINSDSDFKKARDHLDCRMAIVNLLKAHVPKTASDYWFFERTHGLLSNLAYIADKVSEYREKRAVSVTPENGDGRILAEPAVITVPGKIAAERHPEPIST